MLGLMNPMAVYGVLSCLRPFSLFVFSLLKLGEFASPLFFLQLYWRNRPQGSLLKMRGKSDGFGFQKPHGSVPCLKLRTGEVWKRKQLGFGAPQFQYNITSAKMQKWDALRGKTYWTPPGCRIWALTPQAPYPRSWIRTRLVFRPLG